MTEIVEMHSREAANEFRDEFPDSVTGRFDRRHKSVELVDDIDDRRRREAMARREETGGPGQADLTDHERDRIDFSTGRANVPWARSIKALAQEAGVSDWTSHLDPTLTVDEHRNLFEEVAGGPTGPRAGDPSAVEASLAGECDHARGACERGHPDACEFLETECGLDPQVVDDLLPAVAADGGVQKVPYEDLDPSLKGALDRSWSGYEQGIRRIGNLLEDLRREIELTEQAAAAIDAIEDRVTDLETDVFEVLREHHNDLQDLAEAHEGDEFHRLADVELRQREPERPEVVREVPEDPLAEVPPDPPEEPVEGTYGPSAESRDGETSETSEYNPSNPFGVEAFTFRDAVDELQDSLEFGMPVPVDQLVRFARQRGIEGDPSALRDLEEQLRVGDPEDVREAIRKHADTEVHASELESTLTAYGRELR